MAIFLPGTASLIEEVDSRPKRLTQSEKLHVVLQDGRNLIGVLRSYDQFGNLVLQNCYERLVEAPHFAEKRLGLFVVRGENVVFLGDIDENKEKTVLQDKLTEVSWDELTAKQENKTATNLLEDV